MNSAPEIPTVLKHVGERDFPFPAQSMLSLRQGESQEVAHA
jgi:hypothetical protein